MSTEELDKAQFGRELHKRPMVAETMQASHAERGLDLYETPPQATAALINATYIPHSVWDPACGPGAILKVLHATFREIHGTDIENYGSIYQDAVVDFFKVKVPPAQTIVTNPPYKHAAAFVRHALTLVPDVYMLLRLAFLEGTGRSDILDGGHLRNVYVFRNRLPMMHRAGWEGNKLAAGRIPFAWFHWSKAPLEHGDTEGTTLHRITWT
jgi:hypothetical protein